MAANAAQKRTQIAAFMVLGSGLLALGIPLLVVSAEGALRDLERTAALRWGQRVDATIAAKLEQTREYVPHRYLNLEAGAISGQREVEPALYERVNQGDHLAVYFLAGREKRFVIADSFSPVDHERRSGLYLALFAIGSNLFIWVPTLIWRRRDRIAEGR